MDEPGRKSTTGQWSGTEPERGGATGENTCRPLLPPLDATTAADSGTAAVGVLSRWARGTEAMRARGR